MIKKQFSVAIRYFKEKVIQTDAGGVANLILRGGAISFAFAIIGMILGFISNILFARTMELPVWLNTSDDRETNKCIEKYCRYISY